jgi:hypothetical protein
MQPRGLSARAASGSAQHGRISESGVRRGMNRLTGVP